MKRLLFVVNSGSFFLSHRISLAQAAKRAGYAVHVAAPSDGSLRDLERAGYFTHEITLDRRSLGPLSAWTTMRSLRGLYRKVEPHLVHHITIKPILLGTPAAAKEGVPKVINAITGLGWAFTSKSMRSRIVKPLIHRLYRRALHSPNSTALFQNEDDRALFLEHRLVDARRTRVVKGSGLDVHKWARQPMPDDPQEGPLILVPARLLEDKGIDVFVASAKILAARQVRARYAVAGASDPGNPGAFDDTVIESWRRGSPVQFLGHRPDMVDLVRQASVVCLPSRREGVPRALIEGAATGRALVAFDVPGCREICRDGENGILVTSVDPTALADALERLVTDSDLRSRLGARGPAIVAREFSDDVVNRAILEIYREPAAIT